jgi:hypothetical protein
MERMAMQKANSPALTHFLQQTICLSNFLAIDSRLVLVFQQFNPRSQNVTEEALANCTYVRLARRDRIGQLLRNVHRE